MDDDVDDDGVDAEDVDVDGDSDDEDNAAREALDSAAAIVV